MDAQCALCHVHRDATVALWGQVGRQRFDNSDRYAGQRIFVVRRAEYVYLVPFVEDEHTVFLKTIIASRKATEAVPG